MKEMAPYAVNSEFYPKYPGIYSIFAGKIVLYVGMSNNLRRRIEMHNYKDEFIALGATHVEFIKVYGHERRKGYEKKTIMKKGPLINKCSDACIGRWLKGIHKVPLLKELRGEL